MAKVEPAHGKVWEQDFYLVNLQVQDRSRKLSIKGIADLQFAWMKSVLRTVFVRTITVYTSTVGWG